MISAWQVVALAGAHFVGDFALQFPWMAMGKSKSMAPLAAHVLVYSACFLWAGVVYALVNGAVHMVVDFVTSRVNAKNWADKKVRAFWLGVGFDQFLHVATLALTFGVL